MYKNIFFAGINIFLTIHTCRVAAFGIYLNRYKYLEEKLYDLDASVDTLSINTRWIEQPLDHFNATDKRIWEMRYMESLDFWKPEGPIFLFIYGESEAYGRFLKTGILHELAKQTNGAMFLCEHRYYGKSMPLNKSNVENLKYLSSRQALADIANLLENVKSLSQFNESKVVVVGGSYAGNLAAWMKLLYPDLIDAAIASSAPVLAKLDFYEYLETVSNDYEEYGPPGCLDEISKIFKRYDELFKTSDGIETLKKEENVCEDTDLSKKENRYLFFSHRVDEFMGNAQYGRPAKIETHCKNIMNTSRIIVNPKGKYETDFWDAKRRCSDYEFNNMIEEIKKIDWLHSWIYQTCTEFSYFQTTNSDKQPFTKNIPLELYYKTCEMLFGPEFDESRVQVSVEETNELYGGLNPNVTNVVFVNGEMDPWHRLSVLEDLSYDAPTVVIPRSSHCLDLFSNRKNDPEELKEARKYIKYLIKKWIGAGEFKT